MARKVSAILLDTRGIQKYVFSCNKLKTNIGASYLVDKIFNTFMVDVLEESGLKMPETPWYKAQEPVIVTDENIECEIAYIGGGNMLILVGKGNEEESQTICRQIVSAWTERLLINAPGLKTGAAIGTIDLTSPETYGKTKDMLHKRLKENQNNILPEVDLPYTGLTLECDYSGKTADIKCDIEGDGEKGTMVSAEVYAKIKAAKKADEDLFDKHKDCLDDQNGRYGFASDFESIGYKKGESYISVIHIDGNNMGVKFSRTKSITEFKKLSLDVVDAVGDAFKELVSSIKKELEENRNDYEKYLDMSKIETGDGKVLPIRPIIIGGDDVTFICPGRLGIRLAKKFVENVYEKKILTEEQRDRYEAEANEGKLEEDRVSLNTHMSCCAGVAIVPAKYPFFRAYELAEHLCSEAKKYSRRDDSSWLEFAVLHGEAYPDLGLMRKNQYVGARGANGKYRNMHYGPYQIGKPDSSRSIDGLLKLQEVLRKDYDESRSKLKGLREVLFKNDHSIEVFLENDEKLRNILKAEGARLWDDVDGIETTRYLDAIEVMDFVIPELERKEL